MRVHVAFTPAETTRSHRRRRVRPTGRVHDRAGCRRGVRGVYCCAAVEEASAPREELGDAVLAGERGADPIPGFDLGNSPLEFLEPQAETLVLTTTNGTRAMVQAASRCDLVLVGSLLNLRAVATAARERGEDVEVVCAGLLGGYSVDDAYCAGRIAELSGASRRPRPSRRLSWRRRFRLRRRRFARSAGSERPWRRKTWSGARGRASFPRFLASTACAARPRA